MKLWLVTWDIDLIQFLVNAETRDDAIKQAIETNLYIGRICKEVDLDGYDDRWQYSADEIDMKTLWEIITDRDDYWLIHNDVIVFNG